MTVQLLLAPAAAGKTAHVLHLAQDAARGLRAVPRVVVPTHLQVRAWRHRLAEAGGALGVRLLTFSRLYADCLNAAGEAYTELSEPVQYRLIRSVVDALSLEHYAPLAARPGFVQVLEGLIGELKAARVHSEAFAQAVDALSGEPRLLELAQIYTAYQARLQAQGWADSAGLGWLAVEALEVRAPDVARDWPLLVVDGFDTFTEVQVSLLRALAGRVGELVISLTGEIGEEQIPQVHRRFARTRARLEEALGVRAATLPVQRARQAPALAHLEANLFRSPGVQEDSGGALELLEAPNQAAEARAALRWLKARLVEDGMGAGEVALLARQVEPYRPFILQIAAEFGLPLRVVDGLPLRENPAVAALLDLLRLVLPRSAGDAEPALPRRLVVEAWRSPYFDWSARPAADAEWPIGISPGDADRLDMAARYGRVMGGLSQWDEVLDHLARREAPATEDVRPGHPGRAAAEDEEQGMPDGVPVGSSAQALQATFRRFVQRLTPPSGEHPIRGWVRWVEDVIGPDPNLSSDRFPAPEEPTALKVVARARRACGGIEERDVAALRALKDVLRGLVWAGEALGADERVQFSRFFDELVGAVEATHYWLPPHPDRDEILVADVVQARGIPFRAVAVLGLAEGEFPATLSEDPFLRDADRQRLRDLGLPLEPSTQSAELEFFYETATRPRERLCLTRPRLADNGALWPASAFWEEVRRRVRVEPQVLTSDSIPSPAQAASWPELMESLAAHTAPRDVQPWVAREWPERWQALRAATDVLKRRHDPSASSAFDGDLSAMAGALAQRFGQDHTWSASRLESYRTCPFFFFAQKVLGLEPRPEPAEGLDARQLGSIYHRILEHVYQAPGVDDPANLEQLLAALPAVAQGILDAAPRQEGFRETAWWAQTRAEIVANVRRSLEALVKLPGDYTPLLHEAVFGLQEQPALVVSAGDDRFRLCGYIDRVDRAPDGQVRVIDYKTAGPWGYDNKAVAEGKKLQLPLYALAARDALALGEPAEGFYWHVQHAEPSRFQMSAFDGGPEGAMEAAVVQAWDAVMGARGGRFAPRPPDGGCPEYCPAAAFCWQYAPRFGA